MKRLKNNRGIFASFTKFKFNYYYLLDNIPYHRTVQGSSHFSPRDGMRRFATSYSITSLFLFYAKAFRVTVGL